MDTFVVRVYRLDRRSSAEDDRLRGVVEEISTGFQATFQSPTELLSILRRPAGTPSSPTTVSNQERGK